MPKVSVIIPVYDMEPYIRECLDSVVNQTLQDIEFICIDDGSSDQSPEILDDYAAKDHRFKVIHKQNQGVAIARNDGIKAAQGKYIAFMDPDDCYPTLDCLEVMYQKAVLNHALICGGEIASYRNGQFVQAYSGLYKKHYLFDKEGFINFADYQWDYAYYRFIYNREFLLKHRLFFPDYKRFQDPPFFVKAMHLAQKFYALHKITYVYRWRDRKSIWARDKIAGLLRGLRDNLRFAKQHGYRKLYDLTNYRLYKELWPHIWVQMSVGNFFLLCRCALCALCSWGDKKPWLEFIQQHVMTFLRNPFYHLRQQKK